MTSILFIGNSYTYFNKMPEIFKAIAESSGVAVKIDAITKGGYTLMKHADPTEEFTGKRVADALTEENRGKFDYVILQEQSVRPAKDPEMFFEGVSRLIPRIRRVGATPVLYSTWGRKDGSVTLGENGWTHEKMTELLNASYSKMAEEHSALIARVGLAFSEACRKHGELVDLYNPDRSHPSYAGSYLAAVTLFSTIFKINPTSVTYNGELEPEIAALLRECAKLGI